MMNYRYMPKWIVKAIRKDVKRMSLTLTNIKTDFYNNTKIIRAYGHTFLNKDKEKANVILSYFKY